jgi:hypothetical protein
MTSTQAVDASGPAAVDGGRRWALTVLLAGVVPAAGVVSAAIGVVLLSVTGAAATDACAAEAIEARAAAEEFHASHGRFPSDPSELVEAGLLEREPRYVDLGSTDGRAHASPKPGADCPLADD